MPQLTSEGQQKVTELAQRYGVSMDAVLTLLQALVHGHDTMAQFDHPDLDGRGQWMPGGMVMVGDMFNHALKATVDGLCTALAASPLVPAAPARRPMGSRATPHQQQGGGRSTASTHALATGSWGLASPASGAGAWWPAELGLPAASGAQNAMRYAYFPVQHRLAIAVHEHVWIYDTLDHHVSGVSQQQGAGSTVTFTSQHGVVEVTSLPLIAGGRLGSPEEGFMASVRPAAAPPPEPDMAPAQATDILATLERFAELRHKGILSEEEFATKKAGLLRRLSAVRRDWRHRGLLARQRAQRAYGCADASHPQSHTHRISSNEAPKSCTAGAGAAARRDGFSRTACCGPAPFCRRLAPGALGGRIPSRPCYKAVRKRPLSVHEGRVPLACG
jgi:hypothetical protein